MLPYVYSGIKPKGTSSCNMITDESRQSERHYLPRCPRWRTGSCLVSMRLIIPPSGPEEQIPDIAALRNTTTGDMTDL